MTHGREMTAQVCSKLSLVSKRLQPRILVWLGVLPFLLLAGCATPSVAPSLSQPQDIFHADPRWLGGDAAITVPLSEGRVLWLFGDSFVDETPPFSRGEADFISNSLAVQTGDDPNSATMELVWRRDEDGGAASFFPEPGAAWYWPGDGLRLQDGQLAILLHRFAETDGLPGLNFAATGYGLALVANPDAPAATWRMRVFDAKAMPFNALPGAAVVRDGDYVVTLAVRQTGKPAGMLVRWPDAALAAGDLEAAEWWTAGGWRTADKVGPNGPQIVIDDAGAESSIHWDDCARRYVHVASYGFGAASIGMRQAKALTGPWSAPVMVFRPPESDQPDPFVYAGKAHEDLKVSAPRRLAVTYVASSLTPDDLTRPPGDTRLYWPRLVEIAAPACEVRNQPVGERVAR
jgi:hypothetical protein